MGPRVTFSGIKEKKLIRLRLSTFVYTRLVTRLYLSIFVNARLVTRLHSSNDLSTLV